MELGWMGGWMGGFCQGFKAMTSLKCDWSDAVTVGEPSRMMSVLSIFSLQSVEQTVEEWGGGAKLTGNSFTQQQVCVLQSCTKRKKQRASSSSSYFSHLCSQQQMLCVGVSVCVRMCVSVWLWVLVCVFCDIFFFLPGSGSNSSHSSLICFYSKPPLLSLSPFLLYYSLPFFPTHFLSFLLFIVSLISFFILSLLFFFTFPSFHLSPPAILFSSSPPLHLSLILILCLILWPFLLSFPHFPLPLLSSPLHSFIFSFLPSPLLLPLYISYCCWLGLKWNIALWEVGGGGLW